MAILSVNRQIHAESARVLYGSNVFEANDVALGRFLDTRAHSKQYLRRVHIFESMTDGWRKGGVMHSLLQRLGRVAQLRSIEFSIKIQDSWQPVDLAKACEQIATIRCDASEVDGGDVRFALDTFRFPSYPAVAEKIFPKSLLDSRKAQALEYEAAFRGELEALLV